MLFAISVAKPTIFIERLNNYKCCGALSKKDFVEVFEGNKYNSQFSCDIVTRR